MMPTHGSNIFAQLYFWNRTFTNSLCPFDKYLDSLILASMLGGITINPLSKKTNIKNIIF